MLLESLGRKAQEVLNRHWDLPKDVKAVLNDIVSHDADFRRYQWLRTKFSVTAMQGDDTYIPVFCGTLGRAECLDEAIDEAMLAESKL